MEETNNLSKSGLNIVRGDDTNKMEECPICLEQEQLENICPNNHKLCRECFLRVRSIKVRNNMAACPLCRAEIPYVPIRQQIVAVNWNQVMAMEDAFNAQQENNNLFRAIPQDQRIADAKRLFRRNKRENKIPQNAEYGGTHSRKCGHTGCNRRGGSEGVRFLIFGDTGKRRYRCEQHTQ